jgi:hypothetical protein
MLTLHGAEEMGENQASFKKIGFWQKYISQTKYFLGAIQFFRKSTLVYTK